MAHHRRASGGTRPSAAAFRVKSGPSRLYVLTMGRLVCPVCAMAMVTRSATPACAAAVAGPARRVPCITSGVDSRCLCRMRHDKRHRPGAQPSRADVLVPVDATEESSVGERGGDPCALCAPITCPDGAPTHSVCRPRRCPRRLAGVPPSYITIHSRRQRRGACGAGISGSSGHSTPFTDVILGLARYSVSHTGRGDLTASPLGERRAWRPGGAWWWRWWRRRRCPPRAGRGRRRPR